MATPSVPSSRAFLTTLLNTISTIPLPTQPIGNPPSHQHNSPSNPLKQIPASHRPLLTTLHVLFPTLLLPALDLLDRRLVTRLWLVPKPEDEVRYQSSGEEEDDDDDVNEEEDEHAEERRMYAAAAAADGELRRLRRERERRKRRREKEARREGRGRADEAEGQDGQQLSDESRRKTQEREDEEMIEAEGADEAGQQPSPLRPSSPGVSSARPPGAPHPLSPPPAADGPEQGEAQQPLSHIYTVKSSQSTHPRRRKEVLLGGVAEDTSQKIYVVRLAAWNCTCAAFVFASFPGSGSRSFSSREEGDGERRTGRREGKEGGGKGEGRAGGDRKGEQKWEFGGLCLDGTDGSGGGGVPCCKHLLACLLAERWTAGLGGYVEERRVGRHEMAGIIADL